MFQINIGTSIIILSSTVVAAARMVPAYDYDKMEKKSEIILIGHVLSSHETAEQSVLPGITPDVMVRGVETVFLVDLLLKGKTSAPSITLHHYELLDPKEPMLNGPLLIQFEVSARRHFMLFLIREPDGRYAPALGQTDSAFSARRLLDVFDGFRAPGEARAEAAAFDHDFAITRESPDAPIALEFVGMQSRDGLRKEGKFKLLNKSDKDVKAYRFKALCFNHDGALVDRVSSGVGSAVGYKVVAAHGEGELVVRGQTTDNYETERIEAFVTSVTFSDGSTWAAAPTAATRPAVDYSTTRPAQ